MKYVIPAFRKLDSKEIVQIGYQCVYCHMIFDVKMEDLCSKARLVMGRHMTYPPATIPYESVVSRETARIALAFAALTNFPVKVPNIQNSYITATITGMIWTVLGPEFIEYDEKKVILVRVHYGLKSVRAMFWNHLADFMHNLEFLPCRNNIDI